MHLSLGDHPSLRSLVFTLQCCPVGNRINRHFVTSPSCCIFLYNHQQIAAFLPHGVWIFFSILLLTYLIFSNKRTYSTHFDEHPVKGRAAKLTMASPDTALMPGSFPSKEQGGDASLSLEASPSPETWKRYESEEEEISDPESNEQNHSYSPIEPDDSEFNLSDYESMSEAEIVDEAKNAPGKESVNGRVASAILVPRSRPVSVITVKRGSVSFGQDDELMASSPDKSFDRMSMINPRLSAILQDEGIDLDTEVLEATTVSYVMPSSPPNLVSITQVPSVPSRSSRRPLANRGRRVSRGPSSDRVSIRKRSSTAVSRSSTDSPDRYSKRHSRLYFQNPLHSEEVHQLLTSEPDFPRGGFAPRKESLSSYDPRSTSGPAKMEAAEYTQDRGRKRSETTAGLIVDVPPGNLRRVSRRIGAKPIHTVYEPTFTSHSIERSEASRSMSCNRLHPTSDTYTSTGLSDDNFKVSPILLDQLINKEDTSVPRSEESDLSGPPDSGSGSDADTTFSASGQGSLYSDVSSNPKEPNTDHPYQHQDRSSTATPASMSSAIDDVKAETQVGKQETAIPALPKLKRTLKNLRLRRR